MVFDAALIPIRAVNLNKWFIKEYRMSRNVISLLNGSFIFIVQCVLMALAQIS